MSSTTPIPVPEGQPPALPQDPSATRLAALITETAKVRDDDLREGLSKKIDVLRDAASTDPQWVMAADKLSAVIDRVIREL